MSPASMPGEPNPFLHYRDRLDSYQPVVGEAMTDEQFVELVSSLDAKVAAIDGGRGFAVTPLIQADELANAIGLRGQLWIKDETGNVSGSHKARHLFGTAIALLVAESLGAPRADRLAIASCGNAALAAGVVAAAMERPLEVYVPTWADSWIVDRLTDLDAQVIRCPRREDEVGDPAYLRFTEALSAGAQPFSVQGTVTPSAFDGARTIGWEVHDQLPGGVTASDSLFLQVGGGALATSFSRGAGDAALFPVQAEGCAPLERAWRLLDPDVDLAEVEKTPGSYMWAWEKEPRSAATGILDDVTYDWIPLFQRVRSTGGRPVVSREATILEAHRLARAHTDLPVSATGTAGLAGVLTCLAEPDLTGPADRVIVGFTGRG